MSNAVLVLAPVCGDVPYKLEEIYTKVVDILQRLDKPSRTKVVVMPDGLELDRDLFFLTKTLCEEKALIGMFEAGGLNFFVVEV